MRHLCSECGATLAPGATICPACGAALDDEAPTQPLRPSSDDMPTQPLAASEGAAGLAEPAPPPRKRSLIRVVALPALALVLLAALGAGGFWLYAARLHPSSPGAQPRPPLYASSLTTRQAAWQCQQGALCQNDARGLHVLATTDHLYFSFLVGERFSEQVIEVKTKLDNGDPQFVGLVVAFRSTGLNGYGFLIFANGTYQLVKWNDGGMATNLIPLTFSPLIHTGLEQINALKIIAKGPSLTLFVNGHQLKQVYDATFASGGIGLGAARFAADAVFSHLVITRP